jgi:polysaccharide export outer membrane protein
MKNCYAHVLIQVVLLLSITVGLGCSSRPDVIIPPGPPEEGFVLGPEDVIEVVVWRTPDLSRQVVIRPDGKVSLPLIGDVPSSGMTADQLASDIVERFKAYKENPSVSVNVVEVNSYYVFVVGEVTIPGKLPLKSYTTILQALALTGGFTEFASRNDIQVIRNVTNAEGKIKELRIPLRYDDLISEEGGVYNLTLKSGDTIIVP